MTKILIFSLFITLNVFAATEVINPTQQSMKLEAESSEKTVKNSKQNRDKKKMNISFTAGRELGVNAVGTEISYFLEPNSAIYIKYSNDDEDIRSGFENTALVKLGLKKFKSNSFYYKVGAYHLSSNTKHYVKDSSNNYKSVKSTFSELGISGSIGNQWQWENLSVGVDWLGINRTIVELQKFSAPFERTNMTTISALNMQIGYSF